MQKLISGIHNFKEGLFRDERELFERLSLGQNPDVLFVTCSDSRIDPNALTGTQPGDLFVLRNAGNILPAYNGDPTAEAATIEYAVSVLGVKDIVVCGHTHCGAMTALVKGGDRSAIPMVDGWLKNADATRRIVHENYADIDEGSQVRVAIQENVLMQIENLRTHPSVAAAVARGGLGLHGWVYKIESGDVFSYDPGSGQFGAVKATPVVSRPRRLVDVEGVADGK